MKYAILILLALLVTGCGIDKQQCIDNGYEYASVNMFEDIVSCAEIDKEAGLVYLDRLDNSNMSVHSIEDFFGLRKLSKGK